MIEANSLDDLTLDSPTFLTLGAFDGLHLGHQQLIDEMVKAAHMQNVKAAVLTFFPHPSVVLRGRQPSFYIHTPAEKAAMMATLGVDVLVTHPFNRQVAGIRATDFLKQLHDALHMREIRAGADFAIGYKREGTIDWLREQRATYNFEVYMTKPVMLDGEIISSSRVRRVLREGDVAMAARLLGRPMRIPGSVIHGQHRGKTIGFPTANLNIWQERAYPAFGVYACWAHVAGYADPYKAAVNIGIRPTFGGADEHVSLEAHLLDFSGDLYDHTLSLDFIARLRPEVKFSGVDALVAQIGQDVAHARDILAGTPVPTL